jgi:predicted RNase H-like HicB family nuclease
MYVRAKFGSRSHSASRSAFREPGCDVKLKLKFDVVIEPDDDSFHAYCPGLKGLHVDGRTESEAVENALEAARLYVVSMLRHNEPLPDRKGRSLRQRLRRR